MTEQAIKTDRIVRHVIQKSPWPDFAVPIVPNPTLKLQDKALGSLKMPFYARRKARNITLSEFRREIRPNIVAEVEGLG
jgi:hypothetical protein